MIALADCVQACVPSAFGTLRVAWRETNAGPKVLRISLPPEPSQTAARVTVDGTPVSSPPEIAKLVEQMRRFLSGQPVRFDLDLLALETCSNFQRAVLLAEACVPRGWVTSYGRIARRLGAPGGARAVGGALAHNPFPVVIPCHRAIRSDGQLGGYQGGLRMKQALLELEGLEVTSNGRVLTAQLHF